MTDVEAAQILRSMAPLPALGRDFQTDMAAIHAAVAVLERPLPTREAIERAIRTAAWAYDGKRAHKLDLQAATDAVLTLLRGETT